MEATENLFGFEQIKTFSKIDSIQIFEEIRKEIEEHLLEQSEELILLTVSSTFCRS